MVGKQLVGKPAEFAGDEAMQPEERVFGWIQAETETDEYKERNDAFEEQLAEDYDGEIATRFSYLFDPTQGADIATAAIARMKEEGVTTVIISTDPLIPANITKEATAQNYFPEWVIGPSVLADTTIFGRTFDQAQWEHALGLGLTTARAERELTDSYIAYEWYYGEPPAVNTQAVLLLWPERISEASTLPVRTSRPRTSSAACSARPGTTRGSPTRGTPGARACGRSRPQLQR